MSDIMLSFECFVRSNDNSIDLSKDLNGDYIYSKTRKAFKWYRHGYCQGEKG